MCCMRAAFTQLAKGFARHLPPFGEIPKGWWGTWGYEPPNISFPAWWCHQKWSTFAILISKEKYDVHALKFLLQISNGCLKWTQKWLASAPKYINVRDLHFWTMYVFAHEARNPQYLVTPRFPSQYPTPILFFPAQPCRPDPYGACVRWKTNSINNDFIVLLV